MDVAIDAVVLNTMLCWGRQQDRATPANILKLSRQLGIIGTELQKKGLDSPMFDLLMRACMRLGLDVAGQTETDLPADQQRDLAELQRQVARWQAAAAEADPANVVGMSRRETKH